MTVNYNDGKYTIHYADITYVFNNYLAAKQQVDHLLGLLKYREAA